MRYRFIITSLFLISIWPGAFAQEESPYYIRHFDVNNGLSNDWISEIYQDQEGFIWCATQYGLNRFDGQHFTPYTYQAGDTTSIAANWVRSVIQANDKQFFLGTHGNGLSQMDPYRETFSNPLSLLDANKEIGVINKVIKDKKENIWLSTYSGAFRYDRKKKELKQIYENYTAAISTWKNESVLVATAKKGLIAVEKDSAYQFPLLKNKNVTSVFALQPDRILAFADAKLYLLKEENREWSLEWIAIETTYTHTPYYSPFIYRDRQGWIWINGGRWIWRFSSDLQQRKSFELSFLLNFDRSKRLTAHCMFQDREDNLWIGTNLGLFQLIPPRPFRHPVLEDLNQPLSGVREVLECNDQVWFAIFDGLYAWEKGKPKHPRLLYDGRLNALHYASDGYIYSSALNEKTGVKLLKIDPRTHQIEFLAIKGPAFPAGNCWKIVADKNQRLWIAQWNYLICYDLKDRRYFSVYLQKENDDLKLELIDMLIDREDNLWLGSLKHGLLRIPSISDLQENEQPDHQQFLHDKNDPHSISSNIVQSIHQTPEGELWIGTDGGLNYFNPQSQKFQRFLRSDQMPDDKILNVTSDKNGTIWMSTGNGIISFQPGEKEFHVYTTQDGLYDNAMLLSSVFQNEDGFIWMGNTSGIQYFHPDNIRSSTNYRPNLVWESFTRHRSNTTLVHRFPLSGLSREQPLSILPRDQNVTFQFSLLTYKEPQKVRYRFRLKGYHGDWLPVQKNGMLTLTHLPKGEYELAVEGFSVDKGWRTAYASVYLRVIPPWYKTQWAYFLYALTLATLLFIFYRMQLRRKIAETQKEHLEHLARTKTRWFNQIAHEFRTPLTIILGATDQIKARLKGSISKKSGKHLKQIRDQTNHLTQQVSQILEIARMREGQFEIQNTTGDFIAFQRYLLRSFSSLAETQGVELHFSSAKDNLSIAFDEDKWRKITSNLLSNAIKYTAKGGKVFLEIDHIDVKDQSQIRLRVSDTGIGMSPQFISQLFDPFTRAQSGTARGIGLGLALTKELVELMGGKIDVESEEGKGSVFKVLMPVSTLVPGPKDASEAAVHLIEDTSQPLILIAEDHEEVQEYIKFCLATSYRLITASNGRRAWELCQEHIPDLVISDIMMPHWDGLQLGKAIRENVATDHIPIILLTAKSSHDNQLEGLKMGADAYLVKPFNREELLVRVDHLITSRKKLQLKYQKGDFGAASDHKKIDAFIQSVIQAVRENMDNDEFDIQELADSVHISRVHLFRKIKSLTGMSPTKFIRSIRLQKAKDLLTQKELTIAEIAYQTGFKDPAYFTRVYVEEFGQTPSQSRNYTN